jgi:hypothetical protein
MYTIQARNAQQALPRGLNLLKAFAKREESRAGDVLRFPGPVATELFHPNERVIFHPWRDANPFFHIVEAAWMLAGRDDLAQLTPYVARMSEFSDDGGLTQPGAYGRRWRGHALWPDQLDWVIKRLRANPNDRRVVIQMWDPLWDIELADANSADVPCNVSMIPWVMDGALHLSIFNRSNDIIWGLYGANAVHFSMCLEHLAGCLNLNIGTMTTFSNNFHAYVERIPKSISYDLSDPYLTHDVSPLVMSPGEGYTDKFVKEELNNFFDAGPSEAMFKSNWPWVRRVLAPMVFAHQRYKGQRTMRKEGVLNILAAVAATDWRRAATEWVERRL